jgi:hypothetical protein
MHAAMADALLDQIADPIASLTADGGYDPIVSRKCLQQAICVEVFEA